MSNILEKQEVFLPKGDDTDNNISTLEYIQDMLMSPDKMDVVSARITSPSEVVEKKLSEFVTDAFMATNRDLEFNEQLKAELISRLPTLSDNQVIALFSNTNVNLNDKISKLIAPTVGLMTAENQAKIAAQQRREQAQNQILINTTNGIQPPNMGTSALDGEEPKNTREILQGLNDLGRLMGIMKSPQSDILLKNQEDISQGNASYGDSSSDPLSHEDEFIIED